MAIEPSLRRKLSLTRSALANRPLALAEARAILRNSGHTLLSYERMSALYRSVRRLDADDVPGALVECGVCNGGSAGLMAQARRRPRHLWLFDSWEGLPEPGEHDVSYKGVPGYAGLDRADRRTVEDLLFRRLRVPASDVTLVQGWFEETLPANASAVGEVALLHVDCDWHASVKLVLETYYDRVVPGGIVHIDDYGHWKGCRAAVDEFFAAREESPVLERLDYTGVRIRKPIGASP